MDTADKEHPRDPLEWLSDFGIDPANLDEETRECAQSLGPEGVRALIANACGDTTYRGEVITLGNAASLVAQLQRLEETGGAWAPGEPTLGQTPESWTGDELEELMRKLFDAAERD